LEHPAQAMQPIREDIFCDIANATVLNSVCYSTEGGAHLSELFVLDI
jgi:hypothetical protein